MTTKDLAILELKLRIERETLHARNAMLALSRSKSTDRYKRPGRSERASSRYWRRAKRAMRAVGIAKTQLEALLK